MYHQIDLDSIKINKIIYDDGIITSAHITQDDNTNISFQTPILYNLDIIDSRKLNIKFKINEDFRLWLAKLQNKIVEIIENNSSFISCFAHNLSSININERSVTTSEEYKGNMINTNIYKIYDLIIFNIDQQLIDINENISIKNDNRCILNIELSLLNTGEYGSSIEYDLICRKMVILPEIKDIFDFNVTDNEDFKNEISSLANITKNKLSITDKIKLNEFVI